MKDEGEIVSQTKPTFPSSGGQTLFLCVREGNNDDGMNLGKVTQAVARGHILCVSR